MSDMLDLLAQLKPLVINAARAELMPRFRQVSHEFKADGSLLTEADLAMQQAVAEQLSRHWPEYAFLGEEMSETEQQALLDHHHDGLWVLDPVDGTSNFAAGIPYFGVSLALVKEGRVELGLVYDPCRDECFSAVHGKGVWLNDEPLQRPDNYPVEPGIGMIDFKRLDAGLAARLAQSPPYKSQRSFGSVALDWCWLAAGRGHLYLHGRSRMWDYAAGNMIFLEAGGHACTLDGEPVFNNTLQGRSALAALDKTFFTDWYHWLTRT